MYNVEFGESITDFFFRMMLVLKIMAFFILIKVITALDIAVKLDCQMVPL